MAHKGTVLCLTDGLLGASEKCATPFYRGSKATEFPPAHQEITHLSWPEPSAAFLHHPFILPLLYTLELHIHQSLGVHFQEQTLKPTYSAKQYTEQVGDFQENICQVNYLGLSRKTVIYICLYIYKQIHIDRYAYLCQM